MKSGQYQCLTVSNVKAVAESLRDILMSATRIRGVSQVSTHRSLPEPGAAQVRTQCERILVSPGFVRSERQRAFLEFIVSAALDGRADRLKEFTVGIEVFGKEVSFDPSVDSIVRVEASRLRSKLSEYYVDEGRDDAVRITIPKGHYVPEFAFAKSPAAVRMTTDKRPLWLGLAATAAFVALLVSFLGSPQRGSIPEVNLEPPPNPTSVAVLPFQDRSSVPQAYFSESMTDELISSLAGFRPLQVTSITSVRRFANTETPMREIGRALGVAYVVDGSIMRSGESVRLTTHLTDAKSDTQIWSRTFDRPVADLAELHGEVAADIAAQISSESSPSAASTSSELNPVAYEAYMKGRYFYNQFSAEGFRRSVEFYQEAIQIEPEYAEAYAGLASCHCLLAGHGLEIVSPVVAIPEALALAMKALSLNSELAEPHAFLGIIAFKFGWDFDAAEAQLDRAIELNPSLFQAYVWRSQIFEAMGRNDEAISRARKAKQLNPLSLAASLNLGWQLHQAGRYLEARAEIDKLIAFNTNFWGGHWAKGHIHNKHKMHDKAVAEFQLAVELDGGHSLPLSALGYTYAIAGNTEAALGVIDRLEVLSKDVYVSPFHVATIYAGLNQPDLMFLWLEKAFEVRARSLAWLQVTDELLPFADDVRFQDLLQRIGISSGSEPDTQARNTL